ncbi:acyltransferase [Clostridium senegalense]|uniref:acyltransferase n=1 Tax=Clostridium senegalense TaxID=1465809 RepID=UPI000288D68F|nr:acyltransferase [Clostridium senegalense]MBU5226832.1 N-acetyltransferase [Clostridium senegalense]
MNNVYIHPTANVSNLCKIGSGTSIWVNSQVIENAIIGLNCKIGKDTFIDHDVCIGNGVKIQNGVSVYYGITIEDDVFVGPNVTFTNDYYPRSFNTEWKVSKTIIKKGASIGANSTIICGHSLGEYCMIGAGSVVTKDVPSYALVMGNPAKVVGYVCKCGERLVDGKCDKCNFELI